MCACVRLRVCVCACVFEIVCVCVCVCVCGSRFHGSSMGQGCPRQPQLLAHPYRCFCFLLVYFCFQCCSCKGALVSLKCGPTLTYLFFVFLCCSCIVHSCHPLPSSASATGLLYMYFFIFLFFMLILLFCHYCLLCWYCGLRFF